MFDTLKQELARKHINQDKIAQIIDCRRETVCKKISGQYPFTLREAILIKNALQTNKTIEQLFKK